MLTFVSKNLKIVYTITEEEKQGAEIPSPHRPCNNGQEKEEE